MIEWIAIGISVVALLVSFITVWLTWFRKGELKMTQPTVIFFGPDGGTRPGQQAHQKVFLRTLLYSTSHCGQTIESLHVNLQRGESRQNFSIWVYGDDRLARGSGLFVPTDGIACNHHFLLPDDGSEFPILAGEYVLRIYAALANKPAVNELATIRLQVSESHASDLRDENTGIYFDWGPDQQAYQPHIERRPPKPIPAVVLEGAG